MPLLEATVSPALIGRRRELEFLDQALRAVRNGTGRCVLLAGEAGIGKSRLASEVRSRAANKQFTTWQGHCLEQDVSFPYAPWIDTLRAFLAAKSATETIELLGSLSSELVKLLPELSLLVPGLVPTPPLDPEAEKHRLFESLARFATSLAAAHPLLIVLEDLHWSDEPSLELLNYFVRRVSAFRIMVIGTFRSDELRPRLMHYLTQLHRDHLSDNLELAPLTRSEVEQMVRALVQPKDALPSKWVGPLVDMAEGNPFFVEEILKSSPKTGGLDRLQIPHSIQSAVQRRVERLLESTRRLLSVAAAIGDRFDFGLVQQIVGQNEVSTLRMLKELIAAQLIVEESADQFAFRHALTREAVYASLMQREQRAMHEAIGETLERMASAPKPVPAAQLAFHFYQAQVWQKAMAYSQRAGEQAQALYAPREGLAHFTRASDAAQRLGISLPTVLLRGRAQVYDVLGEFDSARADYESALESARSAGDHVDEWRLLIDLGLLWQSRDLAHAGEYYQRALELAHILGESSLLAQTLNRVGNWHFNRGRAREALPLHREALELFRRLDDPRGMAQTMDLLGIVSYQLGDAIQGAAYLEQAVPIWRGLDDRQGLVNSLANLSIRALLDTEVLGDVNYVQLARQSDEARAIAHSFHWDQGQALALMQGAISLRQCGAYGQALERLARARPMVEESRNRESFARLHLITGELLGELLALSQATEHLETGLKLVRELGSGILTVGATSGLAMVAVLQKDFTRAHALLVQLLPTEYPNGDEPPPLRRCWSAYAELELAQGNPHSALEIVQRLLAATPNLTQYGPNAVPRLSQLRGRALAALGQTQEAETEIRGALYVALNHGRRPLLWRLHSDLGRVYRAMGRRNDARREFSSARIIIEELANEIPQGAISLLTGDSQTSLRETFLRQALEAVPAIQAQTRLQAAKKEYGGLTARERQIAALIAHGKSNRAIADKLVISEYTAERHVANILSKLGFHSRTQIAVWATEKGLD